MLGDGLVGEEDVLVVDQREVLKSRVWAGAEQEQVIQSQSHAEPTVEEARGSVKSVKSGGVGGWVQSAWGNTAGKLRARRDRLRVRATTGAANAC